MRRRFVIPCMVALGVVVLVLLQGCHVCSPCAPTVFLREAPAPLPADHPVAIFAQERPACPFDEIALVRITTVHPLWPRRDPSAIYINYLKKAARDRGGDGVIAVRSGQDNETALTGTVIRFADPECRH